MKISKIEASKEQLITAIKLFFNNDNPISIHTLHGAARGILYPLNKKEGKHSGLMSIIKPEMQNELWNKIGGDAQNFFKHAQNDFDKILDFDPFQTEYLMYDTIGLYSSQVDGKITQEMEIFNIYFVLKNQHLIESEKIKNIDATISISNKKYFWEQMLKIASIASKNSISCPQGH